MNPEVVSLSKEIDKLEKELTELRAFKKTVEPAIQAMLDVLYFDSDNGYFDPDKEWDSACDVLETLAEQVLEIYPVPKYKTKRYPKVKIK